MNHSRRITYYSEVTLVKLIAVFLGDERLIPDSPPKGKAIDDMKYMNVTMSVINRSCKEQTPSPSLTVTRIYGFQLTITKNKSYIKHVPAE